MSKTHEVSAQDLFVMKNILQKMKIITNSVFALIPFLNNLLKTSFLWSKSCWGLCGSTVRFWTGMNSDYFDTYYLVYPGRVLLSYLTTLIDSTSLNSSIAYQVTSLTRQAKCLEAIRVSFSVITSFFEKLLMRFFITQIIKRIFILL